MLDAAAILGLEGLMHRKPSELSGGQRQRVAIGRAMVREPKAFLMDEPLSNLDAKLRVHMRAELQRLHERLGTTTVYVTHDQVEAMTLGDRVAVMRDGILQQVDTPQNLYRHPANLFVAAFIGSPPMNLVEATVTGDGVAVRGLRHPDRSRARSPPSTAATVILGIRPSDIEDASLWHGEDLPTIEVTVDVTEELGSEVNVIFRVDAPPVATEEIRAATDEEGEEILLMADDASARRLLRPRRRTHHLDAGVHDPPHAGSVAVPFLRSGVGARDRPGALAGRNLVVRFGRRRQPREIGIARRDVDRQPALDGRPLARRADHPGPSAGELGTLHHRGDAEVSGLRGGLEIGHETPPVVDHAHHDAIRRLARPRSGPTLPPRACAR